MKWIGIPVVTIAAVVALVCTGCNTMSSIPSLASLQTEAPIPTDHAIHTLAPGEDLQQLIDHAPGTVLVDFYADWCGPCGKQAKVLHEVDGFASEVGAEIIKVNTDAHPELSKRFGVNSLPTLVVFRGGQIVHQKTGLTSREDVEAMLSGG